MIDPFIEVFGEMTVATAVYIIAAVAFIFAVYKKCKKAIISKYEQKRNEKQQIKRILKQVEQYPKWRQQSLEIQKQYNRDIAELKERQEKNIKNVKELQEELRKRAVSDLRDRLLQLFRYYSSKQKNPMQAWSEMESKAFWDMYGDYKDAGGNGHMETEVKPKMRALEVIPMEETEKIKLLAESRE